MEAKKMEKPKKLICIGAIVIVAMLCMQVAAVHTEQPTSDDLRQSKIVAKALNDPIPRTVTQGNVLISADNPSGNDFHPRMTKNSQGVMVVVYEKETSVLSKTNPLVYSEDGESWTTQFEFDSVELIDGSGLLDYPDIVYNGPNNLLWYTSVDPAAELYNNVLMFMPGDIVNAEEATGNGISGSGSTNYMYSAAACTNNFFLAATTEDGYGIVQLIGLGWWTYPDFNYPEGLGGFYYDGQSVYPSAPCNGLEMDAGTNRIYFATETLGAVTLKSNTADETLISSGEQQNAMDKYGDIEQMPGEKVADGTDPDVSTSGNKVCVVYVQNGNIKCSYSTNSPLYEPGHSWQASTVDTGASAPAVYMTGDTVYCAYVKGGNVYRAISEDAGATWGTPEKINDVDGKVAAEPGSVCIIDSGVVWTDTRNGAKDIYYGGSLAAAQINVRDIKGGMGVTATVENIGSADASAVAWTMNIGAPLMILGGEKTGTIASLPAGGSETVSSGFVLGIGPATITVSAGGASATASGFVLGPLVLGVK